MTLQIQTAARRAAAAASPDWYRLLHLDRNARSSINDERFFLTDADGTPQQELAANINAMTGQDVLDNDHPRCRFPARYRWLQEQQLITAELSSAARCSDYVAWRQQVNARSVSLIFPAAYLNSPSSMYGHTFLRFDAAESEQGSLWLSWALNFGANINMDDNSLVYAYKGLFGGYPGMFNMMPYFDKIKEYNRMENRDMWEYQLNLSEAEIDRMLAHIWELKDINSDYYFFDENCSYRLLELIDLVRPEAQLTAPFEYTAIPADTVRAVIERGMVSGRYYRPSHRNRFYTQLQTLNPAQQAQVLALSQTSNQSALLELERLPEAQRKATAETAYGLIRLRQNGQQRDAETSRASYRLLRAINQQPLSSSPTAASASATTATTTASTTSAGQPLASDPVDGHRSSTTALGLGNVAEGDFIQLHYRPAYHDLLDPPAGYPPGSQLQMGAVELRAYDSGSVRLQRFDLIKIRSFSPRDQFFQPFSWQLRAGLEQVRSVTDPASADRRDHLAAHLSGGGGVSYALNDSSLVYTLATLRAELNSQLDNDTALALGINPGMTLQLNGIQLGLEAHHEELTEGFSRSRLQLAAQYQINRHQGLRLTARQRWINGSTRDDSLMLEYRVYH